MQRSDGRWKHGEHLLRQPVFIRDTWVRLIAQASGLALLRMVQALVQRKVVESPVAHYHPPGTAWNQGPQRNQGSQAVFLQEVSVAQSRNPPLSRRGLQMPCLGVRAETSYDIEL